MRAFLLMCMLALLAACSVVSPKKQVQDESHEKIMEYIDMGRPKAALSMADELVAAKPSEYESYLTRNAVNLALRDYDAAMRDNEAALKAYEAQAQAYPEAQRNVRLAKIHESFALTALIAADRAKDKEAKRRLEDQFRNHAKLVQSLDEGTYKHLRGLLGDTVEQ